MFLCLVTLMASTSFAAPNSVDTQLLEAAKRGTTEEVRRLLDAGADVNARGDDGVTALHEAAYYGPADVVQLLIDHGADVNARVVKGLTKGDTPPALGSCGRRCSATPFWMLARM